MAALGAILLALTATVAGAGLQAGPTADGTTPLHLAVRDDNLARATDLIRSGASATAANRYGVTPLWLAAVNGSAPMIELLLDSGADPNEANPEGETVLMTAARTGKVDAAKVLLARGAKVDARETWRGQTALMWASAQGHVAMMRLLIESGADVNAKSAFQKWERQLTAEPREKWLPQGVLTPLFFATRQGCVECARTLVDAGADVNAVDQEGASLLVTSLINGHYDVAALLLERGTNPNVADETGRTPLYAAVDMHTMPSSNRPSPREDRNALTSLDIVKALLARGANPNAQLSKIPPYRTKLDRGNDTVLGAGATPFLRAAKAGDVVVMRLLLEKGADPGLATGFGVNALMMAAGLGTKEEDTTGRRKTEAQAIEAITICLEAGLDINATNRAGQTALHGAAVQGFDRVVRFLAERGASLEVKDARGFTPLDAAMGRAGGFGFDGRSGINRETTTALIRQLQATR
jgi:ankyrin repeat protein